MDEGSQHWTVQAIPDAALSLCDLQESRPHMMEKAKEMVPKFVNSRLNSDL